MSLWTPPLPGSPARPARPLAPAARTHPQPGAPPTGSGSRAAQGDSSQAARRAADVHAAFSWSMLISGTRCSLTYLVLPFMAPALGVAAGVGPWAGLALGALAISFNVLSIRRFFLAVHPRRWFYAGISVAVIVLLVVMAVQDLTVLVT